MAQAKYSTQRYNKELMARGYGRDLPISHKHSIEIANHLRNRPVQRAKNILEDAMALKIAIPLKRFVGDVGHRRGPLASGRYMVKACEQILGLIKSVEATAVQKGLSAGSLHISHICSHGAARSYHYGRKRGIMNKRAHMEIVLEQRAVVKKKEKQAKAKIENNTAPEQAKAKVEEKASVATEKKAPAAKKEEKTQQTNKKPEVQQVPKEEKKALPSTEKKTQENKEPKVKKDEVASSKATDQQTK